VLADRYVVPIATLSNFYTNKCLPQLRQFLIDEGWDDR
jgi:hypothetical protein